MSLEEAEEKKESEYIVNCAQKKAGDISGFTKDYKTN